MNKVDYYFDNLVSTFYLFTLAEHTQVGPMLCGSSQLARWRDSAGAKVLSVMALLCYILPIQVYNPVLFIFI